jgi:hypothetical protein
MNTTDKPKQPAHPACTPNPPSEGLLDRLFAWLDMSLVRQAGGELARECHTAVWEVTFEEARGMSRDEARGYIRAFAPEFLLKEVDLVLQRRRVRESLRQRILAEATDQLVELVVKDVYRTKSRRSIGRAA